MKSSGWRERAFVVGLFVATPLCGMFVPPEEVPIDRLLKAAEAAVAKSPASAPAHYTFARVHYLAFVRGTDTAPAYRRPSGDFEPPPEWMVRNGGKAAPTQSNAERAQHAVAALSEFEAVHRIQPDHALGLLGQASLIEQLLAWIEQEHPKDLPASLAKLDYSDARETYLQAYRLTIDADARSRSLPLSGGLSGFVSYEAGQGFLRLLSKASASPTDAAARAEVEAGLKQLKKIPYGPVTPIIFSLAPVSQVEELLASDTTVDFRLRGFGAEEKWPWLKATTGILVWDPIKSADITSGQQLFGNYTFQIFRENGYEALAALDDDGDGLLRGRELAGIRVWFDANGDGHSEPSEVRDLAELEIVAIDVRATSSVGSFPANPRGLIFADGRILPTWDWIATPREQ
jgi:hypothetical protein